jgi:hypothetical protein
MDQIMQMQR